LRSSIIKDYTASGKTGYSKAVGEMMINLKRKSIEVAHENNVPQDLMYGVWKHDVAVMRAAYQVMYTMPMTMRMTPMATALAPSV
jgi:hypothetical protein